MQGIVPVLFSSNRMPGSQLIRLATWSAFSHCDVLLGNGNLIGAVPLKGVIEYPLDERLEHSSVWAIANFTADVDKVEAFLRSQVGRPYDWWGCLGIGLRSRRWQDDSAWFCSELIAAAAAAGGTHLINPQVPTWRVTPQDLLESPALEYDLAHPDAEHLTNN